MTYAETCKCCGRKSTAYTEPLNARLVRPFLRLIDARLRLRRPVKKSELELTHSEYGNFQKIKYFGIISYDAELGVWDVTPLGWNFQRGLVKLETPVAHIDDEVLPADHLAWATHKGKRRIVGILDVLPEEFKGRAEYAAEKRETA